VSKAEAIDTSVGPIGGQALPEGVMMRRGQSWGAAVRRQDGTIGTTSRVLPASLNKWRVMPLVRGVMALGETAALGTKATVWAANERGDAKGDGYTRKGMFATVAIALIAVVGVFGLLPAVIVKLAGIDGAITFPLTEGLIRLGILVGYLWLLGRSPQVQRVFAYHGAEHMTIHAFEHRIELVPSEIRHFSRRHPRCGTAFLLVVVITTMFVHAFMGHASWQMLIVGRILGLPLVAGLAYEAIRFAGRHQHQLIGRLIMAPGSWLQGITTAEPTDDMIEVAVAALEATLAAEPLAPAVTTDSPTPTTPLDLAPAAAGTGR